MNHIKGLFSFSLFLFFGLAVTLSKIGACLHHTMIVSLGHGGATPPPPKFKKKKREHVIPKHNAVASSRSLLLQALHFSVPTLLCLSSFLIPTGHVVMAFETRTLNSNAQV